MFRPFPPSCLERCFSLLTFGVKAEDWIWFTSSGNSIMEAKEKWLTKCNFPIAIVAIDYPHHWSLELVSLVVSSISWDKTMSTCGSLLRPKQVFLKWGGNETNFFLPSSELFEADDYFLGISSCFMPCSRPFTEDDSSLNISDAVNSTQKCRCRANSIPKSGKTKWRISLFLEKN